MLGYLLAFIFISSIQAEVWTGYKTTRTDVISNAVEPATAAKNFGDWHTPHGCPSGQYMRGFQQRIEHGCHGGRECTGLNSIRVLCGTRDDATYQSSVSDYSGLDGDWGNEFICPKGKFVNQFQLYSQKYQGMWSDDMGAGAISARCEGQSQGTDFLSAGFEAQGARSGGYWSEFVGCPSGSVGCAITTSGKTSFPDNTEITNTAWYCCKAPATSRTLVEVIPADRSWKDLAASVADTGAIKAGREFWNKLSDEKKEALWNKLSDEKKEAFKQYMGNEEPAGK